MQVCGHSVVRVGQMFQETQKQPELLETIKSL